MLGAAALAPAVAGAQEFPAPQSRDYTLDLYQGAVLGSGRIVGMGGAAQATAQGSAGLLFNPAAVAVRPSTSHRTWDWDWHFDFLSPQLGSDTDNNGIEQDYQSGTWFRAPLLTGGLVGQYGPWALGVSATLLRQRLGADASTVPTASTGHLALARSFADNQWTVGVGLHTGVFSIAEDTNPSPDVETYQDLFSISGTSLEAGAIWRPPALPLRVGASARLPVTGDKVSTAECDPMDCEGYVLPERAAVPWQVAGGVAWRFARSLWNRTVPGAFRDEKYVLVAADVVVTGHVPHGYGVEAFALHQMQPSGREVGISPRAGVEYEWVPGRFRIRGGSYWEPSRYRDPGGADVPGRLHVTFGLDVRVWSFDLWGDPYRIRVSLTGDGATGYGNSGLSIGFWH